MPLTYPTNVLEVWRRIWARFTPEVSLVIEAPDVGFSLQTKQTFNFPIGILGAGAALSFLLNFEEGIYDLVFSLSYVSGGAADQQMAFRAMIRDQNNQPVWSTMLAITSGQNILFKKRCAIRQGHGIALAN